MLHNHLEILRNALSLGDEKLVALQARKIKTMTVDMPPLQELADLLQSQQYAAAARWLTAYQKEHAAVAAYVDPEIEALKLELRTLEQELIELTAKKEEYEQILEEFNALYYAHCGELVEQILLRQLAAAKNTPEQAAQVEKTFDDFKRAREEAKEPLPELSQEDRDELRMMYKKACQLCHPDTLAEEDKARGTAQFQELQAAYKRNDVAAVQAILAALKSGRGYKDAADDLQEKDALNSRIASTRQKVTTLKNELAAMLADSALQEILTLKDWEAHFAAIRKELQAELARLEAEAG